MKPSIIIDWGPSTAHEASFAIEENELEEIKSDVIGLSARKLSVPRDRFEAWLKFMSSEDYICRGTRKNGRQCRMGVDYYVKPQDFVPSISDRCKFHQYADLSRLKPI
jgi:hypothetical protein